jgi:hypothetical protein
MIATKIRIIEFLKSYSYTVNNLSYMILACGLSCSYSQMQLGSSERFPPVFSS